MKKYRRLALLSPYGAGEFKSRIAFLLLTVLLPAGLVYGQTNRIEDAATIFTRLQSNPNNQILLISLAKAQKTITDKPKQVHYLEVCYLGFLSLGDIKTAEGAKRTLLAVDPANSCCNEYPIEKNYVDCSNCNGAGKTETACPECKGSGDCNMCKGSGQLPGIGKSTRTCSCATTGKSGKCKKCSGKGNLIQVCNKCKGTGKIIDANNVNQAKQAYLNLLQQNPISSSSSATQSLPPSQFDSATSNQSAAAIAPPDACLINFTRKSVKDIEAQEIKLKKEYYEHMEMVRVMSEKVIYGRAGVIGKLPADRFDITLPSDYSNERLYEVRFADSTAILAILPTQAISLGKLTSFRYHRDPSCPAVKITTTDGKLMTVPLLLSSPQSDIDESKNIADEFKKIKRTYFAAKIMLALVGNKDSSKCIVTEREIEEKRQLPSETSLQYDQRKKEWAIALWERGIVVGLVHHSYNKDYRLLFCLVPRSNRYQLNDVSKRSENGADEYYEIDLRQQGSKQEGIFTESSNSPWDQIQLYIADSKSAILNCKKDQVVPSASWFIVYVISNPSNKDLSYSRIVDKGSFAFTCLDDFAQYFSTYIKDID